jgi:hypothetical protein
MEPDGAPQRRYPRPNLAAFLGVGRLRQGAETSLRPPTDRREPKLQRSSTTKQA